MVASMVTKFFCEVVAVVATEEWVVTVLTCCSSVVPVVVGEYIVWISAGHRLASLSLPLVCPCGTVECDCCVEQCWSQICFA